MTYLVRVDPNQSPTVAFSPAEIAVLERLATTQKDPAGHPLTLRDAVRAMAKLGGFLGRKSDGEPGVKTHYPHLFPIGECLSVFDSSLRRSPICHGPMNTSPRD